MRARSTTSADDGVATATITHLGSDSVDQRGAGFQCVGCGSSCARAWATFGASDSVRLLPCPHCGVAVDSCFEFDLATLVLFHLLGDRRATAHIVHNRWAQGSPAGIATSVTQATRAAAVLGALADGYMARTCVSTTAHPVATATFLANWPWLAGSALRHTVGRGLDRAGGDPGRLQLCFAAYSAVGTAVTVLALWALCHVFSPAPPLVRAVSTAAVLARSLPAVVIACVSACGTPHPWLSPALTTLACLTGHSAVAALGRLSNLTASVVFAAAWAVSTAAVAWLSSEAVFEETAEWAAPCQAG